MWGKIDLTFNENNQLVDAQIEAIATNTLPQRKSDLVETNGWELRGHKLLEGTVVADLPKALPNVFPDFKGSHYLAKIFADYMANQGAEQCGFCSPGFIMNVLAMDKELTNPSEEEINRYLAGNLCRCTGYMGQLRALKGFLNRDKEAK